MVRTAQSWFFKGLVLILLAYTARLSSAAAAGSIPRLWAVTEKGHQGALYLLPVTHYDVETEYDDYFYKTIVPIAMKTDVFFLEAAPVESSEVPACPTPLADTPKNREILRQAYSDTERALYDVTAPIQKKPAGLTDQDWADVQEVQHIPTRRATSKLTEYGLILSMAKSLNMAQAQHPEWKSKAGYLFNPDVARYLVRERMAKGIKTNRSIDTTNDVVAAYCNIDSARRGQYLQKELAEYDPTKFVPLSKEKLARLNTSFVHSIQTGVLSGDVEASPQDEYFRHLVCDRNETWLMRMRQDLASGSTTFYALGGAHIFQPGVQHANRCDGLLERLRKDGYTVTLVN